MEELERLRRELADARAELETLRERIRAEEVRKEERLRERRLRASLASLSDEQLARLAAVAAEALQDERMANRVREFARLAFTPAAASDSPEKAKERAMARERAMASLRQSLIGSLVASDPTVAQLTALWGARLRQK